MKSFQAESMDWNSVAIVGEYTVPSGPTIDDHFLVAVFRSGEIVEYSTEKTLQVIPLIEKATGIKVEFRLSNITKTASRIIFPAALAERPLFDFKQSVKGFLGWLKVIRNFGVTEISMDLTKEVKTYLQLPLQK